MKIQFTASYFGTKFLGKLYFMFTSRSKMTQSAFGCHYVLLFKMFWELMYVIRVTNYRYLIQIIVNC